jgi:hydrogenase maturation factor
MAGAIPLYLSLAFIIEEGLSREDLMRVLSLVQAMPREAEPQTDLGDH